MTRTGAGTGARLPQPRLVAVKKLVPFGAKRVPKAVQARVLTAVARRLRRDVEVGDAILVSSSARSGSTWLFEMLASDPAVLPVFEPFHPKHNPHVAPFVDELGHLRPAGGSPPGLSPGLCRTGGDDGAEVAAELGALPALAAETLAGRRLTRWSASRAPRSRLRRSPRTLVKEVRVSRALPWLVDRWPVPVVVLLRHPCAVVESMLRADPAREWLQWPEHQIAAVLRRELGDGAPGWLEDATRPRLLAALWAVETRAALGAARRAGDRCRVVTYEELVRAPEATVARLASFVGLHDVAPDPARLSYMTNPRSPLRQGGVDPLSMWVGRLDPQVADQVVATVHELGIGLYTRDPEPDLPALTAALDRGATDVPGSGTGAGSRSGTGAGSRSGSGGAIASGTGP